MHSNLTNLIRCTSNMVDGTSIMSYSRECKLMYFAWLPHILFLATERRSKTSREPVVVSLDEELWVHAPGYVCKGGYRRKIPRV